MSLIDHGARLTGEEFDRRIVALHSGLPPVPDKKLQREIRRRELDLAIDHRLGCDFPDDRRQALWEIQERIENKRGRLLIGYLFRKTFGSSLSKMAKGLAGYVVDEYAKVLDPIELEQFFGKEEVKNPGLPVDFE